VPEVSTIYDYMRAHSALLGERILQEYPALHQFDDPVSPRVKQLLRTPFPAQSIALMGVAKRWQQARAGMVVAECGTGKTLISLGAIHVHSDGNPFTALAMVPPHLVEKWARETFLTLPGVRVFLIDDLRNGGDENKFHGVNEVRLKKGRIVREGLRTTLSELRLRKDSPSSRKKWLLLCGRPALFIVGRERAKLGYFWRHAYSVPRSGPYLGCVVNSDTGKPVIVDDGRLTAAQFEQLKISETIESRGDKSCRPFHSPLWQADADKIRRMAPIEFIGRYMPGWFDYAICDEVHQLAGDTAQGNALGTLASCSDRIVGLTGTLLGGYADDLFNTLFRLEAGRMKEHGYEWGTSGRGSFTQDYGVLETITKVEPADNKCSKAKTTTVVRRKPGASPLLFGEFLMQLCAFVFPGGHLGRASTLRGNLHQRPDGRRHEGSLPKVGRRHSDGFEEASGESLGHEHDAEHLVALSRPSFWTGNAVRNRIRQRGQMQSSIHHRRNAGSVVRPCLFEGTQAHQRNQNGACGRPALPGLRRLHTQARRHRTAATHSQ